MIELERLLPTLELEPVGPGRFRATNIAGIPAVFGGQLMAQALLAGAFGHDDLRVKTLHTVFARAGRPDEPLEITVDPVHAGRSFASSTVTISQGDRICTRSSILLSAAEPDFIHHADRAPDVPGPAACPADTGNASWPIRIVDGIDIADPDLVGPAELDLWTRFEGIPADAGLDQAMVAFASDAFCIATAMRPHPGVGQALAHVSIQTGVISHTITFHAPARIGEWLLMRHRSPFAGGGRSYGRADVFLEDTTLVASFVQDAMIRPMGS